MQKSFTPGTMAEIVDCDFVNVRSKDSNGDYVIVKGNKLKVGTTVELLAYDSKSGRYKINYKGQDGYIYKDYVRF